VTKYYGLKTLYKGTRRRPFIYHTPKNVAVKERPGGPTSLRTAQTNSLIPRKNRESSTWVDSASYLQSEGPMLSSEESVLRESMSRERETQSEGGGFRHQRRNSYRVGHDLGSIGLRQREEKVPQLLLREKVMGKKNGGGISGLERETGRSAR